MVGERPFAGLSDELLDDVAVACDSAFGEGAFDADGPAADLVRAEYKARERDVPMAYVGGVRVDPDDWLR